MLETGGENDELKIIMGGYEERVNEWVAGYV